MPVGVHVMESMGKPFALHSEVHPFKGHITRGWGGAQQSRSEKDESPQSCVFST